MIYAVLIVKIKQIIIKTFYKKSNLFPLIFFQLAANQVKLFLVNPESAVLKHLR